MNPKILGFPLFGGWLPFIGFCRAQDSVRTEVVFLVQWLGMGVGVTV